MGFVNRYGWLKTFGFKTIIFFIPQPCIFVLIVIGTENKIQSYGILARKIRTLNVQLG